MNTAKTMRAIAKGSLLVTVLAAGVFAVAARGGGPASTTSVDSRDQPMAARDSPAFSIFELQPPTPLDEGALVAAKLLTDDLAAGTSDVADRFGGVDRSTLRSAGTTGRERLYVVSGPALICMFATIVGSDQRTGYQCSTLEAAADPRKLFGRLSRADDDGLLFTVVAPDDIVAIRGRDIKGGEVDFSIETNIATARFDARPAVLISTMRDGTTVERPLVDSDEILPPTLAELNTATE
jgi:hypothetical protein